MRVLPMTPLAGFVKGAAGKTASTRQARPGKNLFRTAVERPVHNGL